MALMLNSTGVVHRGLQRYNSQISRSLSRESEEGHDQDSPRPDQPITDEEHGQEATIELTEIGLQEDDAAAEKKQAGGDVAKVSTAIDRPWSPEEKKRNILKTFFLLFSYSTVGMLYGQFGPTLPDLQKISRVDLDKASGIFTSFAIGNLVGCLVGGMLLEKFNAYLLVFIYMFGNGVVTAVLPWIPEFIAMVVNRLVIGVLIGGHDTATHTMLLQIWVSQGGRFIHLTHIFQAIGGSLAPLITEPFILPLQKEVIVSSSLNVTSGLNDSAGLTGNMTNVTSETIFVPNTESNIHYAFLITGLISAVSSIPMLYIFATEETKKASGDHEADDNKRTDELPTKVKFAILVILCVISFLATACADLFPSFLTTFLIAQLGWEQSTGTVLTSVFFFTYALGNLLSAIIYNKIKTTMLIAISLTSTTTAIVGLMIAVLVDETILIWITVAIMGLSISATLPSLFTWTQIKVTPVNGQIASAYLFSGSAGVMVNPLIMGYLMDNLSPMWFIYFSLGEPCLCLILFALAYLLHRVYSPRQGNADEAKENNETLNPEFASSRENALDS